MASKRKIKQVYNNLSIANKKCCKNSATYYSLGQKYYVDIDKYILHFHRILCLDKEYYLDYEVNENTGIINKNKLVRHYNKQQVERQLNGK